MNEGVAAMEQGAIWTNALTTESTLTASRALLGIVARSISNALNDVTMPQFRVLVVLSGSGPLRMGALAEKMGAVQSTFSRTIDRMVKGGWVERASSPDSRREVLIFATSQGRALVDEVTERRRAELSRILSALSPEEQAQLASAFDVLARVAGETPAEELLILGL
ncbi:hypothetical protein B7R22_06770 [Subtercola boreus]|uniref:HTH marR-type domain-containing protein n=1 Tax=Subtercola boreus TaxID=120213 RepID=A0A3E0VZJ2_9MICO|nr:MarR family transcriptional regulator [Subtercola boreus]RFA15524.1 hypothetical protein B7R22_06770 [Subtercola boreus]